LNKFPLGNIKSISIIAGLIGILPPYDATNLNIEIFVGFCVR
jgi:hypothetical protein